MLHLLKVAGLWKIITWIILNITRVRRVETFINRCRDWGGIDRGDVVNAGSLPLFLPHTHLPHIELLGMASHLSRCSSFDKVPRDAPPVTLAICLQSEQKQPVFILRPRIALLLLRRLFEPGGLRLEVYLAAAGRVVAVGRRLD